jgi:hypothetical protein
MRMSDTSSSFRRIDSNSGNAAMGYQDIFPLGIESHCCAPAPINALSGIKGPTGMYS